ncbi:hypothetical protein [Methanoculleus sp.]|uniref:hypothetical protein n=1 Tax=Methanoculleus sp. TaxID=90427 RepID=UPI002C9F4C40|nr:hypothetical protein [Methanoculleus sp.]HNT07810.1 hypothetical protein [Methanoculleus sp.]
MVNRVSGEIHKKGGILQQTFGETVANAYGLVFYQAADGKLYRAQANAETTVAGVLYLCADAATVKDTVGNALAQGRAEKTGWSWTVGKLVYVSPTEAGGLTQTVPTGTQKIRPVGFATKTDQIDFRPLWGTGATYEVNLPDIPASHGDILVRSATAWGAVPGTTIGAHPLVPDLRNRILRIKDSSGNDLEIHQVWIPPFDSEGFPDPNLNEIECGGFWIDKYQACMFDATNVSRGSSTVNDPGTHGAASMPGVVIWTDINWTNAKIAIENRGGSGNKKTGTCAAFGAGSTTQFYVAAITDLIGRRVRITQGGVTYVRRIVKTGGDKDADANAAKLVEIYPALPANITAADTYEIVQHFLPGQYEWFSLAAWAMKHLYQYGLGYPKGNTNWGKDAADPRNAIYEGRPDPVCPGYDGNAISRCLAGTGPTSWSLNGKESGVYDLVGNAWEWVDMLIGTTADHTIDAEYPGAGLVLPTANGNIATLYAPTKDGNRSLAADAFSPATVGSAKAEYDNDYYYQATGQRAAIRGGHWNSGANCGLFCLSVHLAPSNAYDYIGFRGVC